jgi:hypothetical protein
MTELACKDVVFHFNKAHLKDEKIPMWVIKTKGKTFHVNHVNCTLPWSTKETPNSSHTKGSIKVKHALLTIDENNEATISRLSLEDEKRLSHRREPIRIGWTWSTNLTVMNLMQQLPIEHSDIRMLASGGCTSDWYVCDIYSEEDLVQLKLTVGAGFRTFSSNEWQFQDYDLEEEEEQVV